MANPPTSQSEGWTEVTSETFLRYGALFTPEREAQIATLTGVLPTPPAGAVLWDLCCGGGALSEALAARFADARIVAFDASPAMLAAVERRHGDNPRIATRRFDLAAADWRHPREAPYAIVSSLAIHHLDGAGKRHLFADLHAALAPGGMLAIIDIIAPTGAAGSAAAAAAWRDTVRAQTADEPDAWRVFNDQHWNFYADPDPDPIDQPSSLFDQLDWLRQAGFVEVDAYWLKAGHAIFGGRKREVA